MAVKTEPYDVGDDVTMYADFTDANGAAATPSDYDLTYQRPDGTETTVAKASLSNPSTGRVEHTVTVDQAGTWYYRYRSLAAPKVVRETFFRVRETQFGT